MDFKKLSDLATLFRVSQFYAHQAHNLTYGTSFFSDHAFFGDLYSVYESAYDSLIERIIGLGGKPDIQQIARTAVDKFASQTDSTPDKFYKRVGATEVEIRKLSEAAIEGQSEGTKNFLQGLCDESEQRSYKILQRIKS